MDLYIKYICLYLGIHMDIYFFHTGSLTRKKGIEYFARIFLISDKVCIPDRPHVSLHYNL